MKLLTVGDMMSFFPLVTKTGALISCRRAKLSGLLVKAERAISCAVAPGSMTDPLSVSPLTRRSVLRLNQSLAAARLVSVVEKNNNAICSSVGSPGVEATSLIFGSPLVTPGPGPDCVPEKTAFSTRSGYCQDTY